MLKKTALLLILSSLVVVSLFAQTVVSKRTYFIHLLKGIDSIEVFCLQNNRITKYTIIKQKEIKAFTEIITGRQDLTDSTTDKNRGYLIYYQRGQPKLRVDILGTGIRYKYKNETIISLITYQAAMLFMEMCSPDGFNIKE